MILIVNKTQSTSVFIHIYFLWEYQSSTKLLCMPTNHAFNYWVAFLLNTDTSLTY